jgi:hypothetical protein
MSDCRQVCREPTRIQRIVKEDFRTSYITLLSVTHNLSIRRTKVKSLGAYPSPPHRTLQTNQNEVGKEEIALCLFYKKPYLQRQFDSVYRFNSGPFADARISISSTRVRHFLTPVEELTACLFTDSDSETLLQRSIKTGNRVIGKATHTGRETS